MPEKKQIHVLITGGRGLVGTHLSKLLYDKGYKVSLLGREKDVNGAFPVYPWNYKTESINTDILIETDIIIHLAGANIGEKRWTPSRKQEIIDSRVKTANLLVNKTPLDSGRLKVFVSSSAIGYYGAITSDIIYKEDDPPANDFLGKTCKAWENAALGFERAGVRTVILRSGLVLSKEATALSKMAVPINMGLGSAVGSGKQFVPWIHIEDLCQMYLKAIEDNGMAGAYNAVAPDFVTQKEFARTLAKIKDKSFWMPNVPAFILKIMYGEMSDIILKGSRVSAQKIIEKGFSYRYPSLKEALKDSM